MINIITVLLQHVMLDLHHQYQYYSSSMVIINCLHDEVVHVEFLINLIGCVTPVVLLSWSWTGRGRLRSSPAQTFDTRRSSGQTLQSESLHRVRTCWQLTLGVHRHVSIVSRRPRHRWHKQEMSVSQRTDGEKQSKFSIQRIQSLEKLQLMFVSVRPLDSSVTLRVF